jgi:type VI secretion system protein ImpK
MDRLNWVVHECMVAAQRLRTLAATSHPSPAEVHAQACARIDRLLARAATAGYTSEDARLIAYAAVALLDEAVMVGEGSLRTYWLGQPLQRLYFDESVAGERFFVHLASVRGDPARSDVLRAFHLALALGFEGKYRFSPARHELSVLARQVRAQLARQLSIPEFLSPDLRAPPPGSTSPKRARWRALGAAVVALGAVCYLSLRVSLAIETATVHEVLRGAARTLAAGAS